MSSFHGLEMAKQALFAQQGALYTTSHNIANANTDGFSRQRVNFQTMSPYPSPGMNRPQLPGQMGTGVQIGTIERVRDQFLDAQFRVQTSQAGYWDAKAAALSQMEQILNEPSDSGLSKTMNQFWESLQDLAVNPTSSGARAVVANRGLAVAETFNHLFKSLNVSQADIGSQMDVTTDQVNSLIRQINKINEEVQKIEPHGMLANDLYDQRDLLIDQLSQIVNIKVDHTKSSDSALDIGQGIASIEIVDADGKSFTPNPVYLIEPNDNTVPGPPVINELELTFDANNQAILEVNGVDITTNTIGSLTGMAESYNVIYPKMLAELDQLATAFMEEFNDLHTAGLDLNGDAGLEFFIIDADGKITVNQAILDDPSLIAASSDGTTGNGDHALALAGFFEEKLGGLGDKSVLGFFESIIGKLGVDAQEANRNADNTFILRAQVSQQRMSVSAVSLDEEMSNMIKFQHAYNAAARSMTTIDEMLDRIINQMGIVGR